MFKHDIQRFNNCYIKFPFIYYETYYFESRNIEKP